MTNQMAESTVVPSISPAKRMAGSIQYLAEGVRGLKSLVADLQQREAEKDPPIMQDDPSLATILEEGPDSIVKETDTMNSIVVHLRSMLLNS